MPLAVKRTLGTSSMTRGVKMVSKLVKFWKEKKNSILTASWAESLMAYVVELTANDQFIEQMYDHVAGLLYTMDTAPSQAIVAYPHLVNMGSMTSKLRKTYAWNDKAIEMVQQQQGTQTKTVRFKIFEEFLASENDPEVRKYFRRLMGASIEKNDTDNASEIQSSSTSNKPCTAIFNEEVDITEDDNECLARASELLDMEEDAERMINLA